MREYAAFRTMFIGWGLFLLSLCFPAVSMDSQSSGSDEYFYGVSCLCFTLIPHFWASVGPPTFLYTAVNLSMICSPWCWIKLLGDSRKTFSVWLVMAFFVALSGRLCVDGVDVGFFLWIASVLCAAVAFFLSLPMWEV